ncbi:MAG: hypothetical protein H6732_11935 [Alphaproteobacteria bacterium]|nr:hypothetical protein [Alphaproteobacteria bacterium]
MAEATALQEPAHAARRAVVVAVLATAVVGQAVLQLGPWWGPEGLTWRLLDWWIEDAAISFAYARNAADGLGLVATPGGERVEGFSNPLWVAVLALFELVGLDAFGMSKVLGVLVGGVSVVLAWRLAVIALDDEVGPAPLLAPVLLAAHPTPAIWSASGLENGLLLCGILTATWRTAVEAREGGRPWGALAWLAVAVTRPEGVVYAALGGAVAMVASLRATRSVRPTLAWLAFFFGPFLAYHALRVGYFAWPFPNTYYAKLGDLSVDPWTWTSRGFSQVREWAGQTGAGWLLPLAVVGLAGLRGWRAGLAVLAAVALVALWMHPDAPIARSDWWPEVAVPADWTARRVRLLLVVTALLPLAAAPGPGWTVRALLWGTGAIGLAFGVRANGDWMRGFRWMSFLAPQLAILAALGVAELTGQVRRLAARWPTPGRVAEAVALVAAGLVLAPLGWDHLQAFLVHRETDPAEVKLRVDYTRDVLDRLWVRDRPVANLEVDMGAHLTWTRDRMVDYAGLVDLPIAHHAWRQTRFVEEYLFEEARPDVGHIHKHWGRTTRIPDYPAWRRGWVGLPGYPERASVIHGGMHVRRDLLVRSDQPTGTDLVRFEGGLEVVGVEAPAGAAVEGGRLFLVVRARQRAFAARTDTRLLGFLADERGHVASFDLPLGYDWLPPREWGADETAELKVAVPVGDLPQGTYDLGLVAVGPGGVPLAAVRQEGAWVGADTRASARFARGEVRLPGRVAVVAPEEAARRSDAEVAAAVERATAGACEEAERDWARAWQRVPDDDAGRTTRRARVAPALAACRALRAAAAEDPHAALADLAQARVWDVRSREAWRAADAVADRLASEGAEGWAAEDWEQAFRGYRDAVLADPRRSWARRWAEEARDRRLGLAD